MMKKYFMRIYEQFLVIVKQFRNSLKFMQEKLSVLRNKFEKIWHDLLNPSSVEEKKIELESNSVTFSGLLGLTAKSSPFVGLLLPVALLLIGGIFDSLGVGDFLKERAIDWQNSSRSFWAFMFKKISTQVSETVFDAMTIAVISMVAILGFKKSKEKPSLFDYLQQIELLPTKNQRRLAKTIPAITIITLASTFVWLNFLEKWKTNEGRIVILGEIILFMFYIALNVFILILKKIYNFIYTNTKLKINALNSTRNLNIFLGFMWVATFIPSQYYNYDQPAKTLTLLIIAVSTLLFIVSFYRNWLAFFYIVFWMVILILSDKLAQLIEPQWVWIREILQDILQSKAD